jgi:LPXTG-motif cell wall-anchored protein
MKKFVSKVVSLVLVLTLLFGIMAVSAESLLVRMTVEEGEFTGMHQWQLPANIPSANVTRVVIEHTGTSWAWGYGFGVYDADGEQDYISNDDPRTSMVGNTTILDLTDYPGEFFAVSFGAWFDGDFARFEGIRIYGTGAAAGGGGGGGARVNPLTGDDFNPAWLIVSGMGLFASLSALYVVFKKKSA